jgi:hypothetical protein
MHPIVKDDGALSSTSYTSTSVFNNECFQNSSSLGLFIGIKNLGMNDPNWGTYTSENVNRWISYYKCRKFPQGIGIDMNKADCCYSVDTCVAPSSYTDKTTCLTPENSRCPNNTVR